MGAAGPGSEPESDSDWVRLGLGIRAAAGFREAAQAAAPAAGAELRLAAAPGLWNGPGPAGSEWPKQQREAVEELLRTEGFRVAAPGLPTRARAAFSASLSAGLGA